MRATILLFCLGVALFGALKALFIVFYLERYDPKFRDVPMLAFQIELVGVLLLLVVGGILFGGISSLLGIRPRTGEISRLAIAGAAVAGALYPVGLSVLGKVLRSQLDLESLVHPTAGWTFIVLYPVAVAIILARTAN